MNDLKTIDTLSLKLRLIARINVNQKIDTNNLIIVNNNINTSFWRTIYTICGVQGYSRNDLLTFINQTFDDAYEMIKKYNKSNNSFDKTITYSLKNDIIHAKNNLLIGIKNTYIADIVFVSKLEQLHNFIDIKILSLESDDYTMSEMLNNAVPIQNDFKRLLDDIYHLSPTP